MSSPLAFQPELQQHQFPCQSVQHRIMPGRGQQTMQQLGTGGFLQQGRKSEFIYELYFIFLNSRDTYIVGNGGPDDTFVIPGRGNAVLDTGQSFFLQDYAHSIL